MGDHVKVNSRIRFGLPALALCLALSGCGDPGESPEERQEVIVMLERLGRTGPVAECMAEEFNGEVTIDQLQEMINARGDYSTLDLSLIERVFTAQAECTVSDEE